MVAAMSPGLPTLPVPAVAAAVLAILAIGALHRAGGAGSRWLVALILACAAQAAIVAAVQHYDVAILRRVQPVTASLVPPLAWLAFATTALRARRLPQDRLHVAGPLATAALAGTMPALLDVLVPGLFAGYGAAIAWRVRPGGDAAPGTRLEAGDRPARLWGLIALALIGSGASDVAISVAMASGRGELRPWIITLGSTATLTLVTAGRNLPRTAV